MNLDDHTTGGRIASQQRESVIGVVSDESVGESVFDDLEYLHRISICLRTLSQRVSQETKAAFLIGYTTYLTVRHRLTTLERRLACETIFTSTIQYKHLLSIWDNYDAFSRKEWEPPKKAWKFQSYVNIDGKIIGWENNHGNG